MKIPSIKEIIEKVREQEAERLSFEQEDEIERKTPKDLAFANSRIGEWKRKYSRKNAKDSASIRTSCFSILDKKSGNFHYFFSLQLFVNNVIKEEYNIIEEAFDSISRNPIETLEIPPYTFHYLYRFKSSKNK